MPSTEDYLDYTDAPEPCYTAGLLDCFSVAVTEGGSSVPSPGVDVTFCCDGEGIATAGDDWRSTEITSAEAGA